ncbi:MAG: carboxylase [Candidatus Delongbacteria bacterium]|nr:carboxylase [Candidatus Delongbacteria bacterium]
MKKILIRDLSLRDGQQSQFATRMTQAQVDRVLPFYAKAGFYACEVWGGAVPDSIMRYLNENPWERLEKIKSGIGNTSKLTSLTRGRNLFGYAPYPEDVIEGFTKNAIESGIDIVRIFDALNDIDNMKSSIKFSKQHGGIPDCAVCYTVDPKFTLADKISAFISRKKLPKNIFNINYFVDKAIELEKEGAEIITIKDMAGLIHPSTTSELIKELKKAVKIPIDLHTHDTPGYGLASIFSAIVNGVDIVDAVIMPFAGGPAAPAFELIQIFCDKLGIDTGVDLKEVANISKELREIRKELAEFDTTKMFPIEFDISNYKLETDIDNLFDKAVECAKNDNTDELLVHTQAITKYFNFPDPNQQVKDAEIPGGMYTNMVAQLKQLKLDHLMNRALKLVPKCRVDAGCPPLVTPTSQIVGSQAVNLALDEQNGKLKYSTTTTQFVNLVQGQYGKTPFPVYPKFREKICGSPEEIPYDTSKHKKQDNPLLQNLGYTKLAITEKEELLVELFPNVAVGFLTKIREKEFIKANPDVPYVDIKPKELTQEDYDNLYKENWY